VRGLIKHIDDAIGRMVARLDLASTLVAFTSDHGDYAGHRGLLCKTPWMPFDDLARVPLFYAGNGVAGGRVVSDLVQSYDFALTALDYAGVQPRVGDFDSRSLRPILIDRAQAAELDRPVFSCVGLGWPMVRYGGCKYFVHAQQQTPVLFDLEHDPAERENLADDPHYAEIKRKLSELLAERVAQPPLAHLDAGVDPSRKGEMAY
jgi:choline-sulfatase